MYACNLYIMSHKHTKENNTQMIPEASHGGADYSRAGDSGSSCMNSDDLGGRSGGTLEDKQQGGKVNENL